MRKVLVNLNRNIVSLNGKFYELLQSFYDKYFRNTIEKIAARSGKLFSDILHAIERLKLDKAAEFLLEFLDEADAFIDDIAYRVSSKTFDRIVHAIRELLQVIRAQVIYLDQLRQENLAF